MRIALTLYLCALMLPLAGGEREDLLNTFKKENAEAEKLADEAFTTIELTGAAGNSREIAKTQYLRALDYKLRHTADRRKRLELLDDFYGLSREIQQVADTPREDKGSVIGMHIYYHISSLLKQQTDILLLDSEAEKRWRRIIGAPFYISGQKIWQKQGKGEFTAKMYDREEKLEFILYPKDTFSFRNRDFAVIRTDRRFSGNDDFSTVYLFELKDGKMQVRTKCKFPFFDSWKLQDSEIIFYYDQKMQKVDLLPGK